jgi:hypothetical protein
MAASPRRLGGFFQIILPQAAPGIAAVAIFSFPFSYNEFLISSVFLRDGNLMTMPVGIQSFMQQYLADWGSLRHIGDGADADPFSIYSEIYDFRRHSWSSERLTTKRCRITLEENRQAGRTDRNQMERKSE